MQFNYSEFRKRMQAFSARMPPPPGHPHHDRVVSVLSAMAKYDLDARIRLKELTELQEPFLYSRLKGGAGFITSHTIRHFFLEYYGRLVRVGPHSFPSSFNVMESFLVFSDKYLAFDLRPEREHLLKFSDYLDWYTSSAFPEEPKALLDIMQEGITYGYNMANPVGDFSFETGESKLVIACVCLIRHGDEISVLVVAAEEPPFPADDEIQAMQPENNPSGIYKAGILPDPLYSLKDRYFEGLENHSRVFLMARFNLRRERYDVRYILLDLGNSYKVFTDDTSIFWSDDQRDKSEESMRIGLQRYSSIFGIAASMIYLPAFFVDQHKNVVSTRFATELYGEKQKTQGRKAAKLIGSDCLHYFRNVYCLTARARLGRQDKLKIVPPAFSFETTGYWKGLSPLEIGEDQHGNPVVGKTWVERRDTWTALGLDTFAATKVPKKIEGVDPGRVYIMRSGSHGTDVYKIGLTRRLTDARAQEISSSTGVPSRFETLAEWEVSDCRSVESEVHRRLEAYRVSKRREFFKIPLTLAVSTITDVVNPFPE